MQIVIDLNDFDKSDSWYIDKLDDLKRDYKRIPLYVLLKQIFQIGLLNF